MRTSERPSGLTFVLRPVSLRLLGVVLFGCLVAGALEAESARADLARCIEATCRVSTPSGTMGSGCVFSITDSQVLVITAAHVVEGSPAVSCRFWHRGHQSRPLEAQVVAFDAAADLAVLALPRRVFEGVLPAAVPLAAPQLVLVPGTTITSAGCARGAWATGFEGHTKGYAGLDLYFVPAPADGRSGSALFDAEGRRIVGIVRARTGDDSMGIAASIQAIYAAFGSGRQQSRVGHSSGNVPAGRLVPVRGMTNDQFAMTNRSEQRGSFGHWSLGFDDSASLAVCPGGVCPATPAQPRWYLLPYRFRQQFRDSAPPTPPGPDGVSPTWPTLPPAGTAPAAPAEVGCRVDLGPTHERLDRIARLLEQLHDDLSDASPRAVAPPPAAENTSPPAPSGQQVAIARLHDQVEASRQETSRLRQAVEALASNPEALLRRAEERLARVKSGLGEEADTRQVARAYVRDLAAEQLRSGRAGLTLAHVLSGALGLSGPLAVALGGGLWVLSRRLGARLESSGKAKSA